MHILRRALSAALLLPLFSVSSDARSGQVVLSAIHADSLPLHASCTLACDTSDLGKVVYDQLNTTAKHSVKPGVNNTGTPASERSIPPSGVALANQTDAVGNSAFWNYRNSLFGNTFVQTGIPPAVVNHDGQLVVMYTDKSTNELYFVFGDNDSFGTPIKFVDGSERSYPVSGSQAPALMSFLGDLHAVIQQNSNLIHFIYNDTTQIWNMETVITSSYSVPTLTSFNDQLFLGVVSYSGNKLAWASWNGESGWSSIQPANGESTWGIPALFVQDSKLYMAFAANNDGRQILTLVFNPSAQTWSRASNPPETTAYGVSATYGDELSFVAFQDHRSTGGDFVSVFDGTSWSQSHENTGESSSDTPTMAILDGVVNLVFNSNNGNRDILWTQRPLTNYSLESWMSVIGDNVYLSQLSIPGSHDTTAISYTPTVGCQTMSIIEQLNAGLRYFDLRAGLVNNVPIMFHNFYPIDPPLFLPLSYVIADIQQWLDTHPSEAVVAQIKQDNDPVNSTISFATGVSRVINSNAAAWNLGTTIPALQDVRGKIQLIRRYDVNTTAGEKAIGIDVSSGWQDNNPRFQITTPAGVHFVIQDEYQFDEALEDLIPDKFTLVNNLMNEASSSVASPMTWYIDFASATHKLDVDGFWIMPKDIAVGAWDVVNFVSVSGVNTRLRNQLYGLPVNHRYGTILMDFPESPSDDLIARIIATNM
ncbi:hypothetical protein CVT26_013809 [Gymnopilus dilepis]|uniref:Phosphatidylinositol-specific phospholipase C X domain-containing protein n=1 Tax=Gymnopilus dilepis TaxID=231916 RepID=A0A409Y6S3_9AGAR|nr:hypothetical protein CVT26_013809 [Gymnopilus dilepis]